MAWTDDSIKKIYEEMARQRKAALDQAYQAQMAQLTQQGEALTGTYDDVRKSAYSNSRVSALGNNEALAASGLSGNAYGMPVSGYSETSRVAQNTALGSALNQATRDEASAKNAVRSQMGTAGAEYGSNWASAQSELLAQELASQQEAYQRALTKAQAEVQMFGRVMTKETADILGVPIGTKMKK